MWPKSSTHLSSVGLGEHVRTAFVAILFRIYFCSSNPLKRLDSPAAQHKLNLCLDHPFVLHPRGSPSQPGPRPRLPHLCISPPTPSDSATSLASKASSYSYPRILAAKIGATSRLQKSSAPPRPLPFVLASPCNSSIHFERRNTFTVFVGL